MFQSKLFRTAVLLSLISFAMGLSSSSAWTQKKRSPKAEAQQKTPPKAAESKPGMGGVSTGAARLYTSRRTIGITDDKAPVIFEDVTAQTTLLNFKHLSGGKNKDYILEAPPSGVAIFDYDGDGKPDIYLLNGSTIAALQGKEK